MSTKKVTSNQLPSSAAFAAHRLGFIGLVQTNYRKVKVSDAQREATDPSHRAIERWEDEGGAPLHVYGRQVGDSLHGHDIR
jgi:hypothetical protein